MTDTKTKVSAVKKKAPAEKVMYDWPAIAKKLRRSPGEWFQVFEGDRLSVAAAIRNGGIKAISPTEFEVRTENNKRTAPRTCDLYLRYTGGAR